jgi:hypothetical protein
MTLSLSPLEAAVETELAGRLSGRIDDVRVAMEAEMGLVRRRCLEYLNWYSPAFNEQLGTHDAWRQGAGVAQSLTAEDLGLTRANYPIARAVVDIWTSLEAARPPIPRSEPERLQPPPPVLDQNDAMNLTMMYGLYKRLESMKADARGALFRNAMRMDSFPLKHYLAVRRKNLYGFSWVKVVPDQREQRPRSVVFRNPTVVYPIWSSTEPDDIERLLVAYQINATLANAKYDLGLPMRDGRLVMGQGSGMYQDLNERFYDSTRTMVWVEELWWIDRQFDKQYRETTSKVGCVTRVAGQIIPSSYREYDWRHIPFVPYLNTDERDSYGWSDIASVIDINDEFNRRMSQQGDIIGNYASPRYQLLNSIPGRDVEMPGAFEMIPLQDQERIEQILTRIDVFPAQAHFNILTDLLHRVTGLPPIVWGLIANAQTSGRALTASWKATEARLSPKLMANEHSLRRWESIVIDYFRKYDWHGARDLFKNRAGDPIVDFRWEHPPMEPRDFQEVTMNEITRRDAGLTTTIKAMRATGDEAAEETYEEVKAEFGDVDFHPDKVQAKLLTERSQLENAQLAQQMQMQGAQPPGNLPEAMAQQAQAVTGAPPPGGPGAVPMGAEAGPLPPAQPGVEQPVEGAAPAEASLTSGTLMRGGEVSNQLLETRRL